MSELKKAAKLTYTYDSQLQCISTGIPVENMLTVFVEILVSL